MLAKGLRLAAIACLLAIASPAHSLDAAKAAENMARRASQSYESGDFEHAAELYLAAFRTWNAVPEYLFGAARADQLAGRLDAAELHYRQYADHPHAQPDRAAKARKYLQEITVAKAERRLQDAELAARAGNFKIALQLMLDALVALPGRTDVLLRAARVALSVRELQQAERLARQVLEAANATPEQKRDARALIAEVAGKQAAVASQLAPTTAPGRVGAPMIQPTPTTAPGRVGGGSEPALRLPKGARPPEVPVATTHSLGSDRQRRAIAASAVISGLAIAAGAGGLYLWASSDRSDVDTSLARKNADGLIIGTSRADAAADVASIENRKTAAAIMGGVGAVATLAGAWLWLHDDTAVALAPAPGGVVLAGRW